MSCPFQMDTGVYVLGALSAQEHLQMRIHLKDCASCQTDVADLLAVLPILQNMRAEFRLSQRHALYIDWSANN